MVRLPTFFTALSSFISSTIADSATHNHHPTSQTIREELSLIAVKSIFFDYLVQSGESLAIPSLIEQTRLTQDINDRYLDSKKQPCRGYVIKSTSDLPNELLPCTANPLTTLCTRLKYIETLLSLPPQRISLHEQTLAGLIPLLASAPPIAPEDMAEQIASIINDNTSQSGSFYTPRWLCDQIVQSASTTALQHADTNHRLRIIEPSCGAGSFIISLIKHIPCESIETIQIIDKNPLALSMCDLIVRCFAYSTKLTLPRLQFVNEDFIITPTPSAVIDSADLIIGNPPFGISRGGGLTKEELRHIKTHYELTSKGKPNKYLLFIERSLKLLSSRGLLSFITPNAWLGIDSASRLRTYLLSNRRIDSITVLSKDTWKKLGVETIVTTLRGAPNAADSFPLYRTENSSMSEVPYVTRGTSTISLIRDAKKEALLAEVIQDGVQLKELPEDFFLAVGIQAYKTNGGTPPQSKDVVEKKPYHSTIQHSAEWIGYLEGRDIFPQRIAPPKSYIHYGPHLAECPAFERFCRPRVLLREVLGPPGQLLRAAVATTPLIYNRSILEIAPRGEDALCIAQWLCAYLHTPAAQVQIELLGKKSQRSLFPKIVLSDLKDLYIPRDWRARACQQTGV